MIYFVMAAVAWNIQRHMNRPLNGLCIYLCIYKYITYLDMLQTDKHYVTPIRYLFIIEEFHGKDSLHFTNL